MNLNEKIALITGASSGIGRATALLFAKQGATVVLQARGKDQLNEVEAAIRSESGEAFVYTTDLTDSKACIAAGNSIISEVGIPDIIVNSAGAGYWISTYQTSAEEFHNMMDAPHYAAVHTIKVFLNHMVKRGSGHIVNINSAACYFSFPGAAGYLTSRWAMRGFTQALFQDLRGSGVTASMVVFGKVNSPYFTNNPGSEKRIPTIATSVMKTLSVEEAAEVILKSVVSKRKTIIAPWPMAISVAMSRHFPRAFGYLMKATGYKGIPEELETIRIKAD